MADQQQRQPAEPFPPEALPPFVAPTDQPSKPPTPSLRPSERVGFAVVGLGRLSVEEILPAFGQTKKSRLVALVSGDRAKASRLAAQYGLDERAVYDYDTYDQLADNPAVEAIYVVLPNGMHEEYVVRGARAGKHILCEKPMANTSAEARRMVEACEEAQRKLMVAYRIQYEPTNRAAREVVRSGQFGHVKLIEAFNGQNQGEADQWRHRRELAGGGSLPDIGLYCLNTIRFILGEEPIEIRASIYSTPGDPRFAEVEENCLWQMRFPSGVQANCTTGYGHHLSRRYRVLMERGWVNLDPAFAYRGLEMTVAQLRDGVESIERRQVKPTNQFATEIDHFSDCIIEDKRPFSPGEEGLQDHTLMEAIYQSARSGRPIELAAVESGSWRGPEPTLE